MAVYCSDFDYGCDVSVMSVWFWVLRIYGLPAVCGFLGVGALWALGFVWGFGVFGWFSGVSFAVLVYC